MELTIYRSNNPPHPRRGGYLPPVAWNHFHGAVSAEVLATTADTFVNAGLRDAG